MSIDLAPALERRLREAAERRGVDVGEFVRPTLEHLATMASQPEHSGRSGDPDYLRLFSEVALSLPEDEVQRLPRDGAAKLLRNP
jgi:hypothetical protein